MQNILYTFTNQFIIILMFVGILFLYMTWWVVNSLLKTTGKNPLHFDKHNQAIIEMAWMWALVMIFVDYGKCFVKFYISPSQCGVVVMRWTRLTLRCRVGGHRPRVMAGSLSPCPHHALTPHTTRYVFRWMEVMSREALGFTRADTPQTRYKFWWLEVMAREALGFTRADTPHDEVHLCHLVAQCTGCFLVLRSA